MSTRRQQRLTVGTARKLPNFRIPTNPIPRPSTARCGILLGCVCDIRHRSPSVRDPRYCAPSRNSTTLTVSISTSRSRNRELFLT